MKLVWFRNDLRIHANPALTAAMESGAPVHALVCLYPESWTEHQESVLKLSLYRSRLDELRAELEALNVGLTLLEVGHFSGSSQSIAQFCQDHSVDALFFNREYPLNEMRRDAKVAEKLESTGVAVHQFDGELIIPPGTLKTGQGTDYKVYTPFSRAWRRALPEYDAPIRRLEPQSAPAELESSEIPEDLGWRPLSHNAELWPADSESIRKRVYTFLSEREQSYAQDRDFPAIEGTSQLSPYLAIGAVSPLQLMHAQRAHYANDAWLQSSWLNELIWREFYRHLMFAFPELSMLKPFRPETESRIRWRHEDQLFERWKQGETGFPIVDAAMKQLHHTGWMHNRLRMVVASFLTKLLGVDWRLGEAYFRQHLIDGDFASNLGGWQWSASVGADAAPYFRIFNPTAQSEKFDAQGEFLARWLPELKDLPPKQRHQPGAGQAQGRPAPIIDYKSERQRALDEYNANAA